MPDEINSEINSEILDVLQHASFGLAIIELSGRFRFVNLGFAKLHGLPVSDLLGHDFREQKIRTLPLIESIHQQFVRGEREEFMGDVSFQHLTGDRWFSIECTLVRNREGQPESIVLVALDVTLRKIAEERALQMANRLAAIHHSKCIGMHYFKRDGSVAEPNDALLSMAGLSHDDAKNLTLSEFTGASWRDQDEVMFRRLYKTRRPVSFLKEIESKKTGEAIPVSVTATLFENDPEYDGVGLVSDLSDLFNAREEAEEYRHKADLALSASSIGLWDLSPLTGEVNLDERSRALFGIERKGKNAGALTLQVLSEYIPGDDVQKIGSSIAQLTKSERTISLGVEFRLLPKSGVERIIRATGRTFRVRSTGELRIVGTFMDITETKLFEQRIIESEERFRTLAETIPQVVFTADQDGHVNYVNRKWYDFTGQRPSEAVTHQQIREAIHADDLPLVREKWRKALLDGRAFEIEYRMKSAAGVYRWVIVRASPLLDRFGKTTRWFGSCTDIDEHRRLNDELWLSRDRAEKASQMKSSFLANMSHEIRTPLGAILGFTELLGNGSISPAERADYLGIVVRNSHSLSRIVDDILDLSKVEAGLLTLEKIPFCPRALVQDVANLFSERARQKGLKIDVKIAENVPALIVSDPMRIRQIINNLLSNSLKFTETGGVLVELSKANSSICVAVDDTGKGIGQDHIPALFQPFVQGDESMSRKYGGTGLGLHLSKKLAEALGGNLQFAPKESSPGSRFVLSWPLVEASLISAERWRNEVATHQDGNVANLDGLRILVVDDAADNRKLIERLLIRTGALVSFAENGADAVEQASTNSFDLMLMDLQMPDIDGFEATKQIRAQHVMTPIVALTAHAVDEIRERCERAGFNGFLTKPIDSKSLLRLISDLMAGSSKHVVPNHANLI